MLSNIDILNAVACGRLKVEPFDAALLGPNSLDVRLGDRVLVLDQSVVDTREPVLFSELAPLPQGGWLLQPGQLYLASTMEYTELIDVVATMVGRSSWARMGISVILAAGLGDVGFKGQWTAEITVVRPSIIYPGDRFAQLVFFETESKPTKLYDGGYLGQRGPTPPKKQKPD